MGPNTRLSLAWDSWSPRPPTHFANSAKWMGHTADWVVVSQVPKREGPGAPGQTRSQTVRRQSQNHPGQAVTILPAHHRPVQAELERGFFFPGKGNGSKSLHRVNRCMNRHCVRARLQLCRNAVKSTRAKQATEKLVDRAKKGRFVSGHDFSRAVNTAKSTRPLGPEGCFSRVRVKPTRFSAACYSPNSQWNLS